MCTVVQICDFGIFEGPLPPVVPGKAVEILEIRLPELRDQLIHGALGPRAFGRRHDRLEPVLSIPRDQQVVSIEHRRDLAGLQLVGLAVRACRLLLC